jgi:hypothetical protein
VANLKEKKYALKIKIANLVVNTCSKNDEFFPVNMKEKIYSLIFFR